MTSTTTRPILTRIAFALLWVFVFSIPLTQATEIPAIGLISKVAGLLAMLAGGAAFVQSRQFRLLAPVHMTMALFIVWSAITLCWSVAPELTAQRIMTYLQLFVLVLLIWELCVEEDDVHQILGAFVLGTMLPALSTLEAFLPGRQTLYQRAAIAGFDANSLAFMLALSMPVAYYLILREKRAVSALYRLEMGFAFCAILLTGSAATMIAMVVGLSVVCWTFHLVPVRTRANGFLMFLLLGGTAALFVPASLWQHIGEQSQNGGQMLASMINNGFEGIRSTPVGGYGAGSLSAPAGQVQAVHASSFTVFYETGFVGVACLLSMLVVFALSANGMMGATRSFWFTVLAVWMVGFCSLNWECSQPAWLLFGLLAAHAECTKVEVLTGLEPRAKRAFVEPGVRVWSLAPEK